MMKPEGVIEAENTLVRMAAGVEAAECIVCVSIKRDGSVDYLRHGPEDALAWTRMLGTLSFISTAIANEKILPFRQDFE